MDPTIGESLLIRISERARERFMRFADSKMIKDFSSVLNPYSDRVTDLAKNVKTAYESVLQNKKMSFVSCVGKLDALNPLGVIARGYAAIEKEGRLVSSVLDMEAGDTVTVRLSDGSVNALIQSKQSV